MNDLKRAGDRSATASDKSFHNHYLHKMLVQDVKRAPENFTSFLKLDQVKPVNKHYSQRSVHSTQAMQIPKPLLFKKVHGHE